MQSDQPYNHPVIMAAPTPFVREGVVPICFARPENNGIASVEPFKILLVGSSQAAELAGGYGACLWTDSGRQQIKVILKNGGQVIIDTIVVIPERGVLSLNICADVPKKLPPGGVRVGWVLRLKGQRCAY